MDEILIYSEFKNNRTDYIFSYLLEDLIGLKLLSITNFEEAGNYNGAAIFYTKKDLPGRLCVRPNGLLSETTISTKSIETGVWDGLTVFFTDSPENPVPFDIFSASFWLMSRYEEYLDYTKDIYGRFPARESFAFRAGFLDLPVINLWAAKLSRLLKSYFPGIKTRKNHFHWLATIDIDNAWAYKNKGFFRISKGLAAAMLRGKDFQKRIKVLRGIEDDPFDTFGAIEKIHEEFPEKLNIFVLSGSPGRHDPNSSSKNIEWRELIKHLGSQYQLGLHPSFRSNYRSHILKKEYDTLSALLPYKIKNSRQHFLKIKLPHTYRNLIELGISNDYSMGYPGQPGFRAGLCTPFYFYDLPKEQKTSLKIWPITLMDRTLKDYLHKVPEESMDIIQTYISIIENAGGWFIPVWHNDSLSNYGEWEGWRNVYIKMIETLKSKSS